MPDGRIEGFSAIAEVELHVRGEEDPDLRPVQEFLHRFGYLGEVASAPGVLDTSTSDALIKYQKQNALVPTGDFDDSTRDSMTSARCALPDLDNGVAFATQCSWRKRDLTYAFDTGTADITGEGEFQAVRNAFRTWAAAAPLTFAEVALNETPDIRIGWRPANDPDHSMVGGTLAHADFPPGCSVVTDDLPKPVHFDDTEHTWSIGTVSNAFDVETVALHEIGHILGLAHSSVNGAVMFPTVSSNFTLRVLQPDDIAGVEKLYPGTVVSPTGARPEFGGGHAGNAASSRGR